MWDSFWTQYYTIKWKLKHVEDNTGIIFVGLVPLIAVFGMFYLAWGWLSW